MNKTNYAIFLAGLTIGAAAAWLGLKKRYERISQEEIDSVKEAYSKKADPVTEAINNFTDETINKVLDVNVTQLRNKPNLVEYTNKIAREGYKEEPEMPIDPGPYVIPPEEFGNPDEDDWGAYGLTYYADGALADENDDIVVDEADAVGTDFASHFGEYEDDAVYIRNDERRCDYEILRDLRNYSDISRPEWD